MSKFTVHNGLESNDVNSPINVSTGLEVGGLSFPSLAGVAWYVDAASTAGAGANGRTRGTAFTTIAAAISAAAAHDTIVVYPGTYAENLTVSTNYLTIAGAATGYGRPDIAPATGTCLTGAAQGLILQSLRFASGDGTDAVIQQGNGFRFVDCVFDDASDASEAGLRLKGKASDDAFTASEGVIKDCLFRGCAVGLIFDTGDAPTNGVGVTHVVVDSCRFIDNTQDIVTADTGGGVYSVQDTVITGCQFLDKGKTNYIDLTTSNGGAAGDQTGLISNCYFATDDLTTTNVAYVGTGFAVVGCFDAVGVEDSSALD